MGLQPLDKVQYGRAYRRTGDLDEEAARRVEALSRRVLSMGAISPQRALACRQGIDAFYVRDVRALKVLKLNYSDNNGGAAAHYRIHHAIRDSGIDSKMLVNVAAPGDWTVQGPTSKWARPLVALGPNSYSIAPVVGYEQPDYPLASGTPITMA